MKWYEPIIIGVMAGVSTVVAVCVIQVIISLF